MKVIVCVFLILEFVYCEIPPPYPSNRFKSSPRLPQTRYGVPNDQPFRQPQTVYGPPPNAEPLDPLFRQSANPAKFQILQNPQYKTIREPQRIQSQYGPPPNAEPIDPFYNQSPNPTKFSTFQNAPQTIYGVPKILNNLAQNQQSPQIIYGPPQTNYGVPDKQIVPQNQNNFASGPSSNSVPQTLYGAPNQQTIPQNQNSFASGAPNSVPQTLYGAPNQQTIPRNQNSFASGASNSVPQNLYGAPDQQFIPQNNFDSFTKNSQPGAPNTQRNLPRNYGTPNVDPATLEEIKQLRELIQKIEAQRIAQIIHGNDNQDKRHGQSLPNKEAGNFRFSFAEQYLPVKEPENFKTDSSLLFNRPEGARQNNFNSQRGDQQPVVPTNYVPSQYNPDSSRNRPSNSGNSWNNLDLPSGTSPDVNVQKVEVTQFGPTTFRPNNNNEGEVDNKYIPPNTTSNPSKRRPRPTTIRPLVSTPDDTYESSQDDVTESPNVAVATAVAGDSGDQPYYLIQPDGRYQRIILSKTRPQTEKQSQFSNNYQLYQNLQVDPNLFYTPVYSVLAK